MLGSITFLNSDDVVPIGIVEVDPLLVGKMLNFFIDWVLSSNYLSLCVSLESLLSCSI